MASLWLSHLLRSILAKSEFDNGFVSPAAFSAAAAPFSALPPGPLCRCRERGSSESWVRPLPLLGRQKTSFVSEHSQHTWRQTKRQDVPVDLRSKDLARDVHGQPAGTSVIHRVPAGRVTYGNGNLIVLHAHAVHFQNCMRGLGLIRKLHICQTLQRHTARDGQLTSS